MKYTDEQLSLILGEHSAGQLVRNGYYDWNLLGWFIGKPFGCIEQVADNCPDEDEPGLRERREWFDEHYNAVQTVEEFLGVLEDNEFA